MADWKQIQARIRKAKNSSDPVARLSELYAKTRDGMAAFEVGAAAEKAGRMEEAVHWYTTAHGRFRRTEWRNKAGDALSRLGAPVPAPTDAPPDMHDRESTNAGSQEIPVASAESHGRTSSAPRDWSLGESRQAPREDAIASVADQALRAHGTQGTAAHPHQALPPSAERRETGDVPALPEGAKRRRRGRRGGHGRGRQAGLSPAKFAVGRNAESQAEVKVSLTAKPPVAETRASFVWEAEDGEPAAPLFGIPMRAEGPAAAYRSPGRSRLADPGISSRLAQLEALLRRLIAASEHPLSEAEEAPAGPGVFVLSDSDLVTFYYVEACRTLRVAIANLAKGRNVRATRTRSSPSESSPIRARLSEHLDISEAKVSQYMKQHCVVRWLQLDDEAHHLAHLAIAVLRPPLNSE
jgi:hypothetical protein